MVPGRALGDGPPMDARSALPVLAAAALACGGEAGPDAAAQVEALAAPGPYAVGYRTLDVAYEAPLTGAQRTLTALAWYPAEAAPEAEDPVYFLRAPELAKVEAPPLDLGPRPVVLVSHGHQGYPAGQSFLTEHLASHGFVVVAPTHTGNTFVDGDARETDIYYLRAHDVSKTLDSLQALPASDPLAALVGDRIAVVGHSFGGYTAFALAGARYDMDTWVEACAGAMSGRPFCSKMGDEEQAVFRAGLEDPRMSAVVSLDPGDFDLFGAAGVAAVDRPVLHMVAEQSGLPPGAPEQDPYWTSLSGADDVRVLLLGGAHNDFTDACAAGLDVRCSDLPARPVWRLVRVYVLGFLQRALEGATAADEILSGRAEVSPLAETTSR